MKNLIHQINISLYKKISVIIPCYNSVDFIEKTLLSIVSQQYPNLELIIVDGNSTDGTLEIIKKFDEYIDVLISEVDNGQYDAVRKGLAISNGEILCWLNSDDIYMPWTFELVNNFFLNNEGFMWISGSTLLIDENGIPMYTSNNIGSKNSKDIKKGLYRKNYFGYLQQEGMFWKRDLYELSGGLSLNYSLAADFELWIKFARIAEIVSVSAPLAGFRIQKQNRSIVLAEKYEQEVKEIIDTIYSNKLIKKNFTPSRLFSIVFRVLKWRKSHIYSYSLILRKWILSKNRLPVFINTISQYIFEINALKKK